MEAPPATSSRLAEFLRTTFRRYRDCPVNPGHAVVRRIFRSALARHQRITLRNGIRMEVDLERGGQSTIFWLDGDLEPQLEWVMRELVPVGGACVDCGANCGMIGLLARRLRGSRVLFIEPHPRLAATIRRNLELNGWTEDCPVVEAAASDRVGEAVLFEHEVFDGSHSLHADWVTDQPPKDRLSVALRPLRDLLDEHPGFQQVKLLKIDTEGHDLSVLRGLGDRLNPATIATIYAEIGRDRDEAFQLLTTSGYVGFAYHPLNRRALRRLLHRYGDRRPVALFHPWSPPAYPATETLWVGRDTPAHTHLQRLAKDPTAQPR